MKLSNGYREFDFTIGADPEFFVAKGGKPISAHGLIPGNKKVPHKVGDGAVQVDGMALEFNINPSYNEEEFIKNLDSVMATIMSMVPGYDFYSHPVADFGLEYIQAQPEEAKILGCEPDYNAYTMQANPTPDGEKPFRTASGHIHIGWTNGVDPFDADHFNACARLARTLDYTLGVPSLLWDKDDRRRELYGKAGAFRPKPYGMEYRTLSCAWLNPDFKHWRKYVYHQSIQAIKDLLADPEADERKISGKTAREIIDSGDREVAFHAVLYNKTHPLPNKWKDA